MPPLDRHLLLAGVALERRRDAPGHSLVVLRAPGHHHPRSDLRQNPSFFSVGERGWGVQAEGRVAYRVWRGLSAEAGYRYWRIESGEGTTEARGVTGTSVIGHTRSSPRAAW